jgi:uncharacterized phage-associated protein
MSQGTFDFSKATQTLNYLALQAGGCINAMKAYKLIWLADRLHLRTYGRPILNDIYYAVKLGPIPSFTKDIAEDSCDTEMESQYRNNVISKEGHNLLSKNNIDKSVFSKTDMDILDKIYQKFGHMSHWELSDLSHEFPEWKKHESSLNMGFANRHVMNYEDFFLNPSKDFDIFNEKDEFLKMSQDYFKGIC